MIEWIVTSSALILLVLVLRLTVRERVSPRLRYALWGLVLLRLLAPGTVWESRASVMTPIAAQEVRQEAPPATVVPDDFPGFSLPFAPDSNPYLDSVEPEIVDPSAMGQSFLDPTRYVPLEQKKPLDWGTLLTGVWLAGVAAVGLFLVGVNLKFYLNLKRNRQAVGEYRGRSVYLAGDLTTPCLFGLLRPSIYLTPGLDENETAHVLAHEYTHFRQGDHTWAFLRSVCLALHWYNPLVWLAAVLSRRDCELSCDEGAVRLLGEAYRADYGRTLVGLVARRTTPKDLACCATTMTGGKSVLKERIALLIKQPRTTAVMAVLVAAACVAFAVCTFTGAAEAEEPDAPAEPAPAEDTELREVDSPAGLPYLDELPTEVIQGYTLYDLSDNTEPYWLLDQLHDEDIALYAVNPMGTADEVQGIYLRYGEHLQYFDQVASPYIITLPHLTWYDFDGDGTNELLTVYTVSRGSTVDKSELVIYEWEGDRWSEHKYDPAGLMEDFNANAEFESDGAVSRISYGGGSTQVALGGEECFIRGGVVSYTPYGKDGWGILLSLTGEIGPARTSTNYAFGYTCDIYYNPDGSFTEGNGILSSFYEPDLPALEDLPTEVVRQDVPGAYMESILMLAELPAEDIAVYQDQRTSHTRSLIRYGDHLQAVGENLNGGSLPELYFSDLDGDGEKELAVTYKAGHGTGMFISKLTVYEWNGERWTGYTANLEQGIIEDFSVNSTLTRYPDQGRAVIGYGREALDVDMVARFGNRSLWSGMSAVCELREEMYSYSRESYGLSLKIGGEIRPEGYPPTTCYAFDYICNVYYEGDGMFRSTWGYLDTDYLWSPEMDVTRLTPTFRNILRGFMRETLEMPGIEQADLINDFFAICDVNGDGRDELITQRNNGITAAHAEEVYSQDGNFLLYAYPRLVTYYDNGYVTAGWSHNQGRAGDKLWPYTLYKYDAGSGRYEQIASVDGWDKQHGDTYHSSNPQNYGLLHFPDDADKDGDGFVYYLITEEGGYAPAYGTPMDYSEWAEWAAAYSGGNVVTPAYIRLTEENIALIG